MSSSFNASADRQTDLLSAALALAAQGIPVFPCKQDKRPACEGGFTVATTDPEQIKRLFSNPLAWLIGVPTGAASGYVALDYDPRNGSEGYAQANEHQMPTTQTHRTRSGGFHKLFKLVPGLRCSAGKIAPGVDIRADGGYIIWWPAHDGEVLNAGTIAEMPEWLQVQIMQAGSILHDNAAPLASEELAPPCCADVIELLVATPNPAEANRGDYISVMMAVQRTLRGGQAAGVLTDDEADAIKDAAADWAARWDSANASDWETERRKWDSDWSTRTNDVSGWRQLLGVARRLGLDTSSWEAEAAKAEFDKHPLTPLNDLPEPEAKPDAKTAESESVFGGPAYQLRDPSQIPPRQWIYGRHYIRGFPSATVAPGGVGKSSLSLAEILDMVTGKGLLTGVPGRQYRVLYWCGEDPMDEIERRVGAICKHYGITAENIGDRLILVSGRDHKLVVATAGRDGAQINQKVIDSLTRRISRDNVDVLVCDPFVCTHAVPENDNVAINMVVDAFRDIAEKTQIAVELVHHTRKAAAGQSGNDRTVSDGRGAGALVDATRSARVLNQMGDDDAAMLGIADEDRRLYFRVDNGKANLVPPAKVAVWRRLASVDLCNGRDGAPGDYVGVVEKWERPAVDAGVTEAHMAELHRLLVAGGYGRRDFRAADWAGNTLAAVLGLDPSEKIARKRLQALLESFIKSKVLKVVPKPKPTGNKSMVDYLIPGFAIAPTGSPV